MNFSAEIENYVTNRDQNSVRQISNSLIEKKSSFLDLILSFGDYFQSGEVSKRSTALTLLSLVLENCPDSQLTEKEIHHLVDFLVARLSDHHIFGQTIVDLFFTLSKQSSIGDEDCLSIVRSIFADVYVQSFPQTSRYKVFVIFLNFLRNRIEMIKKTGTDFVCNFIQSMDGERDPRDLIICFQCIQLIVKHLEFDPFKEELFEVVACYFPLEQKSKTKNPENEETINEEQLCLSLRNIFCSTDKFSTFCLPMLIEKLESEIPSAQIAAIDVFIHCVEEYEARSINNYLVPMWNHLCKQALCNQNQEIETKSLSGITALFQLIGKSLQNDETEISTKNFVDRAIRECANFLKELDQKLIWPSVKVFQAIVRANPTCAALIWSKVLPLLIGQFENLNELNHKKTVFELIVFLLQPTGMKTVVKLPNEVSDRLWLLVSAEFDAFTVHCLTLIHYLLVLNSTPAQLLEDNLTNFIVKTTIPEDFKPKLSLVLKNLASSVSYDRISTNLLTNLINSATATKTALTPDVLSCCIDLCFNAERCQERLERFFVPNESFLPFLPNLFKYLAPSYVLENLFVPLFDILTSTIFTNPFSRIFCAKVASVADESSTNFVKKFISETFLDDSIWNESEEKKSFAAIFFIANLKRKFFESDLIFLFEKIHEKLFSRAIEEPNEEKSIIFAYFHANLVNKLSKNVSIGEKTEKLLELSESISDRRNVRVWSVVVKGLIFAVPSLIDRFVEKIVFSMKKNDSIGLEFCKSLLVLSEIDDSPLLLSLETDCLVHPMIKQIFFNSIFKNFKVLLSKNELSNDETNIFVELLSKVPNSILREEIVTLLPILIRSLSFSNETVWLSALNSIADLIESQPLVIVEHLESLLPRLMNLATTQNSMNVRVLSLKSLKNLTSLPIHKIQPYRRSIIQLVKKSLDDHKRIVRKQAVETQMAWCLLNV